jgi:hypothetical protein
VISSVTISFFFVDLACCFLLSFYLVQDRTSGIRVAIGNGLRADIWQQFQEVKEKQHGKMNDGRHSRKKSSDFEPKFAISKAIRHWSHLRVLRRH